MSDGELRKRIQRQFLSNRWSQPSDIFPIMDECKRDIETVLITNKEEYFGTDGYTYEQGLELLKIFNKWFGEAEK